MRPRPLSSPACGVCRTTAFLVAALAAAAASARDSDGLWPAGVAAELEALLQTDAPTDPSPAVSETDASTRADATAAESETSADDAAPCVLQLITQRLSRPSTPVTREPAVAEPGLAAPVVNDESLREIDRVVDLFEANPLLRGTLRHALDDEEDQLEATLPPLGNQDTELTAPPPGDARLELCPVWGRVRGAMVRLIF